MMIKECMECEALFEVMENFQRCPYCDADENLEKFKYNSISDVEIDIKELEEELNAYPEGSYEQEQVNDDIEQLVNIAIRMSQWSIL